MGAADFTFISSRYWSFAQKASVEQSRRAGEQVSRRAGEQVSKWAGGRQCARDLRCRTTSPRMRRDYRAIVRNRSNNYSLKPRVSSVWLWSHECRVPWVEWRGCRVRDRLQLRGWRDSSWFLVRWPVGATAGATVRVLANKLLVITDYLIYLDVFRDARTALQRPEGKCLRMSHLSRTLHTEIPYINI